MKVSSGLAIILRITPFKDFDAILEFFTEKKGKISVLAKGIRRDKSKNKGHCRIGALVEYELFSAKQEKGIALLKKIITQKTCLSENIHEQTRLMILAEVSSQFLSSDKSESEIFELWKNIVFKTPLTENLLRGFLCIFFQKEGFFPVFKIFQKEEINEIEQNKKNIYWDSEFGIVSETSLSSPQKKISLDILKMFHFYSHFPLNFSEKIQLNSHQAHEWWEIFWWFYSSHSEYFPRSKKIYEQL